MHAKPVQLRIHIEIQERAQGSRHNVRIQHARTLRRHGARLAVVSTADVRGVGDVEHVDVPVIRQRPVLAVAEAAVARQHEELAVGQGVDLGLGCDLGVLGGFGGWVRV